jgi:hypothetical protein
MPTGGHDIPPLRSALDGFDEQLLGADLSKPILTVAFLLYPRP